MLAPNKMHLIGTYFAEIAFVKPSPLLQAEPYNAKMRASKTILTT